MIKSMAPIKRRQECEVYSRVNGYYRPVNQWNDGKREEFKDRLEFALYEEDNQESCC